MRCYVLLSNEKSFEEIHLSKLCLRGKYVSETSNNRHWRLERLALRMLNIYIKSSIFPL